MTSIHERYTDKAIPRDSTLEISDEGAVILNLRHNGTPELVFSPGQQLKFEMLARPNFEDETWYIFRTEEGKLISVYGDDDLFGEINIVIERRE